MIIDVSYHDGVIDWEKAKPEIEGAIIRCGYGQDLKKQDDKQYQRNISECKRLGIPFGVYFYSYAATLDKVDGEIKHLKRLIEGVEMQFQIFIDLEEDKNANIAKEVAEKFLKALEDYDVGIYANTWWWDNYLKGLKCKKWVAAWNVEQPTYDNMVLWQYDAYGTVKGVGTKSVDLNKNIALVINHPVTPVKKSIDELAREVIAEKWGDGEERKKRLTAAGYDYQTVQDRVNEILGVGTKKYMTVTGVNYALNMRNKPGMSGDIITTIPKGAKVELLEKTTANWYKVKYNGKTGYCWADYLKA